MNPHGRGKFCDRDDCACFAFSFASSPHAAEFDIKRNNKVTPRQVTKSSHKKYWFACNNCEHSFESALNNITSGQWCPFPPCCKTPKQLCEKEDCQHCWNASFASSPHAAEFDIERNNKVTPRQVPKSSGNKYWFTCNNCEHSFESALYSITNGRWCPFPPCCTTPKQLCEEEDCQHCWNASFASSPHAAEFDIERNNKVTPRQVPKSSSKKYWFTCNNCEHSFESALSSITSGHWCPFPPCCTRTQKLCKEEDCQHCWNASFASSPHAAEFDIERNKIERNKVTPRQVTKNSNKKYWFACNDCHHSFQSSLYHITSGKWCPSCKHKTEKKVFQHVRDMYPDTRHGFRADWCRNPQTKRYLPFDILLEAEKKIIVEVDGRQHFEVVKKWKSCPEKQLQRDTYKTIQALKHGYSMVRICQRSVCSSWDWVAALEAAIHDCLSYDKHIEVYVAEDLAQYDGHQVSITEDALQDIDTDDLELLSGMSDTSSEDAESNSMI